MSIPSGSTCKYKIRREVCISDKHASFLNFVFAEMRYLSADRNEGSESKLINLYLFIQSIIFPA